MTTPPELTRELIFRAMSNTVVTHHQPIDFDDFMVYFRNAKKVRVIKDDHSKTDT